MSKSGAGAVLKFAKNNEGELLQLPLSMLMQTVFLGGYKGSGKTVAMKRLFEAAHHAGAQCGVIAPAGSWWSVRVAKNGKGRGLSRVFVFGGKFGDVTITAESGRSIARAVISKRIHFVLDVELLRPKDRSKFLADFFEELWHLKKAQTQKSSLVLFIDEAQIVAPQTTHGEDAERMKEAVVELCQLGRNHGFGLVVSAQRSANVSKDLLALVEMLIVMRTIHHLDREVYRKWIDEKGDKDEDAGAWLKRLRRLEKGQAYLYAPELNLFERVDVLLPTTYDATKTATIGERVAKVGRLSKLDVYKLGEELSAVVAESEANDPTKLRAQVKLLQTQIGHLQHQQQAVGEKFHAERAAKLQKPNLRIEKRLAKHARIAGVLSLKAERLVEKFAAAGAEFMAAAQKLKPQETRNEEKARLFAVRYGAGSGEAYDKLTGTTRIERGAAKFAARVAEAQSAAIRAHDAAFKNGHAKPSDAPAPAQLGKGERIVMGAIAQYPNGIKREQLTVVTGYKTSTRNAYLLRLANAGYVHEAGDMFMPTSQGIAWLGPSFRPLPKGEALRDHWLEKLPEGEGRVLQVLLSAYPNSVTREQISEKSGYEKVSTRNAYLYRLIGRQLVTDSAGVVRASAHLFEATS